MRKKFLVITMCMCMAVMTAACSTGTTNSTEKTTITEESNTSSENESDVQSNAADSQADIYNVIFEDNGYVKDVNAGDLVKLYDYSQIKTIDKADVAPSDQEVQSTIDQVRKMFAKTKEVRDRAVEDGDIICMDFTGKVDGVEFEGGKSENYVFDPRYDNFIDGFYEQIIGHTPSEEPFDIQVKFPDGYREESLRGKDATFTIVLHYIEEDDLPEFNDAFVKDTLGETVTAEEYRQNIKDSLQQEKVMDYLYDKILEESSVDSIPQTIIDALMKIVDTTSKQQAAENGLSLEDFYKQIDADGTRREELCNNQAKAILVIQAMAEKEGIEANDDNVIEYFGTTDMRDSYVQQFGKGYSYSGALPALVIQKIAQNVTVE